MTLDLHLHSDASDGTCAPEEVVRRAATAGLATIALADHDTTAGVARAVEAGRAQGIRVVPAIELTARVPSRGTVHVLGYGVDPSSADLALVARRSRTGKREQARAILDRLRALGIPIDPSEVGLAQGEDRYVGRNRIASALVQRGLSKSRLRAFKAFLGPGGRAFVEPDVVPAGDALAAISAAGGLAVLAHPTEADLSRHLPALAELGLAGIELHRPKLAGSLLARVEKAARRLRLLPTGGSDWHGLYPDPPLGTWKLEEERVVAFMERLGG